MLVKQDVRCKKHEAVSVKGVSHPVQTYKVSGLIKDSKQKESPIDCTMPGLSLAFDPFDLEDHDAAIKLLSSVLKQLNPKFKVPTGKK